MASVCTHGFDGQPTSLD
uniref:Uncharacterized protein n=1 Tax=Anguilla anguilla TaxID=7936 RepID=A0A0E9XYN7_ANGAN